MTVQKNLPALNAEMFVGVCLTGGALLLGILGTQLFKLRKAGSKNRNFAEVSIN
jgi:hypothetical protein